ncbi:MAG TPA: 3-oxoacyl-ACP reductase family protein [Gemmataceae bacterium]|nr:3-oxoacyl-ACP reductase family protein [Gemmataceae bacterium]
MDLELKGKKALVTGGSRGIGRAIVLALARQGVSVAACYQRESDAVASLADELRKLGNDSHTAQADVSDPASVAKLVGGVRDRFGRIDVLVNNAGVVSHKPLADLDLAEWQRVINTNLTSMYLVTKAAVEAMPRGGSVINVTSAVAMVGMVGRTHYTASKAGVIGFTRSLCKELGPRGIRVNALAPGIIETDQAAGLTPEQRTRYANLAALARLGQPDDIADVVLFLASDLSRFVSGITINVDGGI